MKSMTGFGRGTAPLPCGLQGEIVVEISSVNRKQLELKITLPREMASSDTAVRKLLSERLSRGSVSLRAEVRAGGSSNHTVKIDRDAMKKVFDEVKAMSAEAGIEFTPDPVKLLSIPGIVEISNIDLSEVPDAEKELLSAVNKALDAFIAMRQTEGDNLEKDVRKHLEIIRETVKKIAVFTPELAKQQYERLCKRFEEFNVAAGHDTEERLIREFAVFADKADVTEELTRLDSHFAQFDDALNNRKDAVGRQLDFIVQEMFREITTLANKASTANVSPLAVLVKTELEKIREQVQNIE